MNTSYLNTDLDLVAVCDLVPLAKALEVRGIFPLYVTQADDGRWYATFETDNQHETPETTVAAMLDAIESFHESIRVLWWECSLREFNIGYHCGHEPRAFNDGLTNTILLRIANAGASLRITLYPPEPDTESLENRKARPQ